MLAISNGLLYSHAYIKNENKKENVLSLSSDNKEILTGFVALYNEDQTTNKENSKNYFVAHMIEQLPPDQPSMPLREIKAKYFEIAQNHLWENDLPKNAVRSNSTIKQLTNQFFEKLNSQTSQAQK